jgi:fumarylacetoacetase
MTVTGTNLEVCDLIGSGTISGDTVNTLGSLLEASWNGEREVMVGGGHSRKWVEDGDTVRIKARAGHGVGFGDCTGRVLPALNDHQYY